MEIKLLDEKDARGKEISVMAKQLKDLTDRADGDSLAKETRIKFLEEALKNLERRLADETKGLQN
jgi:hypothetical protein